MYLRGIVLCSDFLSLALVPFGHDQPPRLPTNKVQELHRVWTYPIFFTAFPGLVTLMAALVRTTRVLRSRLGHYATVKTPSSHRCVKCSDMNSQLVG